MGHVVFSFVKGKIGNQRPLVFMLALIMLYTVFMPLGVPGIPGLDVAVADVGEGDWLEYQVVYTGPNGNTTNWTYTVTEVGVTKDSVDDCYHMVADIVPNNAYRTSHSVIGDSEVLVDASEDWRVEADAGMVHRYSHQSEVPFIGQNTAETFHENVVGYPGWPFEVSDTWTYQARTASAMSWIDQYTAEVVSDNAIVNVGGTDYPCYEVVHTLTSSTANPATGDGNIVTEYWAKGDRPFAGPLKVVDTVSFVGTETRTLVSADPMPPCPVAFSSAVYSVNEGDGVATIEVVISNSSPDTIQVDYATSDGTAEDPFDYAGTSGTLTFVPGDVSETFDVIIFDDGDVEGDEVFNIELSSPVNATLGSTSTATLTIVDDESDPEVSFSSVSYEVDEGDGVATIEVLLSKTTWQIVTIDYATNDGTAMEPGDYAAASGTLTFVPGDVSETFDVTIEDDLDDEDNEDLNLTLSNPVNVTVVPPDAAVLTIVDNDGIRVPGDYPTIQAAINASVAGDTVIVADGTYTGLGNRDLEFFGKAITVRSENGPDNCIINCQAAFLNYHRGFHFRSGEGPDSVLDGFTITNGFHQYGGGIQCNASSPTIKNCILLNNRAVGFFLLGLDPPRGGGMYCFANSSPILTHCMFLGNQSVRDWGMLDGYGGGFECLNSTPTLINCVFSGNIAGTNGGGMYNWNSSSVITNCTFNGNIANTVGQDTVPNMLGGGAMYNYAGGNPVVTNCILWGNDAILNNDDEIKEVGVFGGPQVWATVTYSNVAGGWPGEGNINSDPLFVYDYYLSTESPCIDVGSNDAVPAWLIEDIEGDARKLDGDGDGSATVDMGADEFVYTCYRDNDADYDIDGLDLADFAVEYSIDPIGFDLKDFADKFGRTSCQ